MATAAALAHKAATAAASSLQSRLPPNFTPRFGIIGGSGLAALEGALQGPRVEVGYGEVEGFPVSTVAGHAGKLVFGYVGPSRVPTVLMNGRAHLYEGNQLQTATFPVRVLSLLGVKTLIVTNAAGGLNPEYKVGDVVVLHDHINFPGLGGLNPLSGPDIDEVGPRFLALSDAYDLELRRTAHAAWKAVSQAESTKMTLHEGVYAFVGGPNYETRAECRMLSILGADLVGMSTVPEILVARHCGVRILAMSLVTNNAVLEPAPRGNDANFASADEAKMQEALNKGKANHEEVLEASRDAAENIKKLIVQIVEVEGTRT